ncbi:cbb3-type cytochrome c oxidase N-terminal domain-containing protein [Bergeyella zoohelcum]|uniref:Cytochrome c oxidase, cbb3-type, subunit III n=1 Tax=Bergeyella zoohelcum TaxID=1015 RepID=A0A7Z8YNS0_9FLAO|nr:c-type cytochrome [Bergeyella zoohelcum]VDH03357.1 cytochrome c oxidase, cbb3-type, subunit III [Bergeyella zoohelcum]
MKPRTPIIVNILVILTILFIVYYMFIQSTAFLSSAYFWGTVVIACVLALIHNAISDLIENAKFKELSEEERRAYLEAKNKPYFKSLWESAFKKQSNKDEKDILIDHGFDGIMELDNQLPKWWLGLFWFGVAYCVVYIISFAFTSFANPTDEYETEYKQQIAAIDEYMKTVPQKTIETAEYNSDFIAEGEEVFKTNCVSCHMDGGAGGIGPNLTDNYWINQPEETLFKSVFHVVYNGSPNNPAMVAFGQNGQLTGNDIEKVAAYIYHINQELPDAQGGAAPQGEEAKWK